MKFSVITSTYNQLDKLKRLREHLNKQTFYDFQWIIADDGSSETTGKWAKDNCDEYVWQEDWGYRLTKILNKASHRACGDYLVWIMADSYPEPNFLETINQLMDENTLATGLRININEEGRYVSHDWRVAFFKDKLDDISIEITGEAPYKAMTLNSMIMPRDKYIEMGGIHPGYDEGYGKMDWDMAAWAWTNGMDLRVFPRAIIYHDQHSDRKDTENNTNLFFKRLEEMCENSN